MSGLLGDRHNTGKARWGLLSWVALAELVKVLEFGAKKYASWNWAKGLSWTDTFESLQRHLLAWYNGEDKDPETGLSHMAHVLCNAMFLMHFIVTRTGRDDRYFSTKENPENADQQESLAGCSEVDGYVAEGSQEPRRGEVFSCRSWTTPDPYLGQPDADIRPVILRY